ncbi:hypothetical protein AB1L42_17900 [Thalassoglobus sp. JC818]|uniref:hypothetical protein n=1 Tax=Thalassoglobus sp. JC818 TaxID=3232136 RepID=UPI003458F41F
MTFTKSAVILRLFNVLAWLFAGALCLLLVFISVGFAFILYEHSTWNASIVRESKSRGDVVVALLEEHYRLHGRFPDALDELHNENNIRYEQPTSGVRQWQYRVKNDGDDFVLTFSANKDRYPICFYDSEVKEWYGDS